MASRGVKFEKYAWAENSIAAAPPPPEGLSSWDLARNHPETLQGEPFLKALKEMGEDVLETVMVDEGSITAAEFTERKDAGLLARAKRGKKSMSYITEAYAKETARYRKNHGFLRDDDGEEEQVGNEIALDHSDNDGAVATQQEAGEHGGEESRDEGQVQEGGEREERAGDGKSNENCEDDEYADSIAGNQMDVDENGMFPMSGPSGPTHRYFAVDPDATIRLNAPGKRGTTWCWTENEARWRATRHLSRPFYREMGIKIEDVRESEDVPHNLRRVNDDA